MMRHQSNIIVKRAQLHEGHAIFRDMIVHIIKKYNRKQNNHPKYILKKSAGALYN